MTSRNGCTRRITTFQLEAKCSHQVHSPCIITPAAFNIRHRMQASAAGEEDTSSVYARHTDEEPAGHAVAATKPIAGRNSGIKKRRKAQAHPPPRLFKWEPTSEQSACSLIKNTEMMCLVLERHHLCKSWMQDQHFEERLFTTESLSHTLMKRYSILVLLHLRMIHICHQWAFTIMPPPSLMCSPLRS